MKCKHLIKLYKHPLNKLESVKGSIMVESGLYACIAPLFEGDGCVMDSEECMCECFQEITCNDDQNNV